MLTHDYVAFLHSRCTRMLFLAHAVDADDDAFAHDINLLYHSIQKQLRITSITLSTCTVVREYRLSRPGLRGHSLAICLLQWARRWCVVGGVIAAVIGRSNHVYELLARTLIDPNEEEGRGGKRRRRGALCNHL